MLVITLAILLSEVPGKPIGPISFSDIQPESVTINWFTPRKDGGSPVLSYFIEINNESGAKFNLLENVFAPCTIYTARELTQDKQYRFQIRAVNAVGQSEALVSDYVTPHHVIS